jgi:type I restriction enzyme M protein
MLEMEDEHGSEDGLFAELLEDGELIISDKAAKARLKEIKGDKTTAAEAFALNEWLKLAAREKELKKFVKDAEVTLDDLAYARYPSLTEDEVRTLAVDDKWMVALETRIASETARVAQGLSRRVRELGERYTAPLPILIDRVADLDSKVAAHLKSMGFA